LYGDNHPPVTIKLDETTLGYTYGRLGSIRSLEFSAFIDVACLSSLITCE
jgi:hypothetical protein